MTKRPIPQGFRVTIAPEAWQQFDVLPQRTARAVHGFVRTVMREDPETQGVRLRGHHMEGYFLIVKTSFQMTYKVNNAQRTVSILRIEPR